MPYFISEKVEKIEVEDSIEISQCESDIPISTLCESCGDSIQSDEPHDCVRFSPVPPPPNPPVVPKPAIKRRIVQQEIYNPPSIRAVAKKPKVQPTKEEGSTLDFIKKLREKLSSNKDIDVDKMIKNAGPPARKNPEKPLTPVAVTELPISRPMGLDFIRRQMKNKNADPPQKPVENAPKRVGNRKIHTPNSAKSIRPKPENGKAEKKDVVVNQLVIDIVGKLKQEAAEKAKLEELANAKSLADQEKREMERQAQKEKRKVEEKRRQVCIIRQRRLHAAVQIAKKSKKFQCPDCLMDFGIDLKQFFLHLKSDHTKTADYDHYEGTKLSKYFLNKIRTSVQNLTP